MSVKPITLTVFGKASQKIIANISIAPEALFEYGQISLMNFLINNGIRIASSCSGEGVCKKCVVNENLISCQMTLAEYLNEKNDDTIIIVNYL